MSYAKNFASRQLVMGGIALRMLHTYQCIDEMPTPQERDRTAKLYSFLDQVEHWKAQPLMGATVGMIVGISIAGLVTHGDAIDHGFGIPVGLVGGLVLGFLVSKLAYFDRRLKMVRGQIDEMFRTDPATWQSLEALKQFDPQVVRCAWKLLPQRST